MDVTKIVIVKANLDTENKSTINTDSFSWRRFYISYKQVTNRRNMHVFELFIAEQFSSRTMFPLISVSPSDLLTG